MLIYYRLPLKVYLELKNTLEEVCPDLKGSRFVTEVDKVYKQLIEISNCPRDYLRYVERANASHKSRR